MFRFKGQFQKTHGFKKPATYLSGGEQATVGGFIPRRAARRASRGCFSTRKGGRKFSTFLRACVRPCARPSLRPRKLKTLKKTSTTYSRDAGASKLLAKLD